MKRSKRFRLAEQLEARCVLSAADAFDFGGADSMVAFSQRDDQEIGPAYVSSIAPLQFDLHEPGTVAQPLPPAPLSVSALDTVFSQATEAGMSTTVTATMTRSNDTLERRDFEQSGLGSPAGTLLGASSADRSMISPSTTSKVTQPAWSVTVSLTFGPVLPHGWSSAWQHVTEHISSSATVVFQFVQSLSVPESNNGRPPAPVRLVGRISPPDFALMVAAAVKAQTAWAAAYISEAASHTEPTSLSDASNAAKKEGGIQRASDESQANSATTNSTRSHNGAEEGGFIEFALLSSSDAKAAQSKDEDDSLEVLPEGDQLLPWEVDEEAIDELLAADVGDEESSTETDGASPVDAARMAFSANEGGLVSLDGTVFAEIDPAQYAETNDARTVAAAEPVVVRMDAVLRLFQAFEVTTDVLNTDAESTTELISVPVESLPLEAVPVDAVAPKPQESGPRDASQAAAALVVGMVSVGATLGRRSRDRNERGGGTGDTERVS